jgi:STE24 endopeptidase
MEKIHPLLDPEKQRQARLYEKQKRLLGLAGMLVSLVILLLFYFSGMSERAAGLFPGKSPVLTFLVYVTAFLCALSFLSLPLDYYRGFVHEHKWKFSNQTARGWLWEKLKSFLVSLVIGWVVLGLLLWIMTALPDLWWLVAGLAMALVSAVFATLFPVLILPLFNKYAPIQDQELTAALSAFLTKEGLKSGGFFKEDMSRQTKKENAFLAGLWKTRRVILSDNLMNNMAVPEVVSVIAHEIGHYKHKHILKSILLGTAQQIVVFFGLNIIMRRIFPEFPSSVRSNLALLPILLIAMGGLSGLLFGPLSMALSRRFERQADRFSLENTEDKRPFMTAMAGLANRNLADAYPARWMTILFYSHPPIGDRLKMAEEYRKT